MSEKVEKAIEVEMSLWIGGIRCHRCGAVRYITNDTALDKAIIIQEENDIDNYLCSLLKPREYYVICSAFGLNYTEILSLEIIGKHLNLTSERVRQIRETALKKLRRNDKFNRRYSLED